MFQNRKNGQHLQVIWKTLRYWREFSITQSSFVYSGRLIQERTVLHGVLSSNRHLSFIWMPSYRCGLQNLSCCVCFWQKKNMYVYKLYPDMFITVRVYYYFGSDYRSSFSGWDQMAVATFSSDCFQSKRLWDWACAFVNPIIRFWVV